MPIFLAVHCRAGMHIPTVRYKAHERSLFGERCSSSVRRSFACLRFDQTPFDIMANTQDKGVLAANDLEKEQPLYVEELGVAEDPMSDTKRKYLQRGLTSEEADFLLSLSDKEKNQIYRKVDFRLVPMLALLYLVRSARTSRHSYAHNFTGFPSRPCQHRQC